MGIASVVLVYDLVRRRFGRARWLRRRPRPGAHADDGRDLAPQQPRRPAGARLRGGGVVRRAGAGRRPHPLAGRSPGVCVGLGFETKMGVALAVVPGIAAAWMWVAPAARGQAPRAAPAARGRRARCCSWAAPGRRSSNSRPASSRPWIAGTSDNRVLSLIFEYNGLGRVDGQAGGPAGGPGGGQNNMFGGGSGPLRLLNSALGGQVGWLLGFALVTTLAMVLGVASAPPRPAHRVAARGRRRVPRRRCALQLRQRDLPPLLRLPAGAIPGGPRGGRRGRAVRPAPESAGGGPGRDRRGRDRRARDPRPLPGPAPLAGAGADRASACSRSPCSRSRAHRGHARVALAVAIAALLAAPAVWAFDTLSYATSSTFPSGGPASAETEGQGFGVRRTRASCAASAPAARPAPGAVRLLGFGRVRLGAGTAGSGAAGGRALFGSSGSGTGSAGPGRVDASGAGAGFGGGPPAAPAAGRLRRQPLRRQRRLPEQRPCPTSTRTAAARSRSRASRARPRSIIARGANVVGIGGFSGRESEVSRSWLAEEVRAGKIRWVLAEEGGPGQSVGGIGASGGARRAGARNRLLRGARHSALLGGAAPAGPAEKPAWAPKR